MSPTRNIKDKTTSKQHVRTRSQLQRNYSLELARLRRQVHTIQIQQQDANTGRVSNRTGCIRLAPWRSTLNNIVLVDCNMCLLLKSPPLQVQMYWITPDQPVGFTTLCQTSLTVVQLHVVYCLNRYLVLSFDWSELVMHVVVYLRRCFL